MIAEELINQMIPPLKPEDTAERALAWMEEFRCSQLPVVEQGKLLGFISEEMLVDSNEELKPVGHFQLIHLNCKVSCDAHFYEVVKVSGEHKMQLVAVMNDLGLYTGVIAVSDIMATFSQTAAIQMPGSILVLSMELIDYSLAEIARLVEENNAKIISSTLVQDPLDQGKIRLTIKINQADLGRIVATLERFDYKIIGRYQETHFTDPEKERFDLLMRYLNI